MCVEIQEITDILLLLSICHTFKKFDKSTQKTEFSLVMPFV